MDFVFLPVQSNQFVSLLQDPKSDILLSLGFFLAGIKGGGALNGLGGDDL